MDRYTVIIFDYGGCYSEIGDEAEWIPSKCHNYTLVLKELSELTYSEVVGRICRKIGLVEDSTKLRLSYFPITGKKEHKQWVTILDDEDVLGYALHYKDDKASVLHVELIKSVSQNQSCETPFDGRNEEIASDVLLLANVPYNPDDENDRVANMDSYDRCDDVEITLNEQPNEVLNHEWDDGIDMTVGQEFESKQAVKDLVERAIHQNCFEVATDKSTKTLYVLKCRDKECQWSLRVAKRKDSNLFSVRTYKKMHACSRVATSTNRQVSRKGTPRLVASVLHDDYPGQFNTPTPKTLIGLVQGKMGVKVSYSTAWRGRKQAASDVRRSPEESYIRLPSYLYMLEKMNPGTVTCVKCGEQQTFEYLFIALGACIEGFKAMRKVIIVDGTHLKTTHGGVLIVATAQDPDRHHYPIAFGVVDAEKDDSWRWFLSMLKIIVADAPELVFVSDRNQSIIKTISEVYPQAKHGYCIYHLSQNVKLRVHGVNKDEVAKKFRSCAQAYTESEFLTLYDAFRKRYPKAVEYLEESTTPNKWAKCYFPRERYNIDITNCAESINSVFREARKYSLLPMLDAIVAKISEWFNKYRKLSAEAPIAQILVPRVDSDLHTRCQEAKLLVVGELNTFLLEYFVIRRDGKNYYVNMERKTCSCKYFDIDRYPCVHAIAAAVAYTQTGKKLDLHELCSMYYFIEQWSLAYYRTIYPVPHMADWNVPDNVQAIRVVPPHYNKRKGRQQTTRLPSVGEHRTRRRRGVWGVFTE